MDILNLSFGLQQDSEVLRYAIQEASEAGIIIVAAAGNKGIVEYPASYPEVIAVGSVNSMAEIAEKSAVGENLELLAPGELVASISHFGGVGVESGTSLAAPHVTGAISLLLQKNPSASADLIRYILQKSANRQVEEGYGLLDVEQAVAVMDRMMPGGEGIQNSAMNLADNEKTIEVFENDLVEGSWKKDIHQALVGNPGWAYFKNPAEKCNYIVCYLYLIDLAQDIYDDGKLNESQPLNIDSTTYKREYEAINTKIKDDNVNGFSWTYAFNNDKVSVGKVTKARQCAYLYRMALHVVTDLFAHSAYVPEGNNGYVHILHGKDATTGADSPNEYPNRYGCAEEIAQKVVLHYYNNKITPSKADGQISDFILTKYQSTVNDRFRIRNLGTQVKEMDENLYNANKTYFDAINYTKPKQE